MGQHLARFCSKRSEALGLTMSISIEVLVKMFQEVLRRLMCDKEAMGKFLDSKMTRRCRAIKTLLAVALLRRTLRADPHLKSRLSYPGILKSVSAVAPFFRRWMSWTVTIATPCTARIATGARCPLWSGSCTHASSVIRSTSVRRAFAGKTTRSVICSW